MIRGNDIDIFGQNFYTSYYIPPHFKYIRDKRMRSNFFSQVVDESEHGKLNLKNLIYQHRKVKSGKTTSTFSMQSGKYAGFLQGCLSEHKGEYKGSLRDDASPNIKRSHTRIARNLTKYLSHTYH